MAVNVCVICLFMQAYALRGLAAVLLHLLSLHCQLLCLQTSAQPVLFTQTHGCALYLTLAFLCPSALWIANLTVQPECM